MKTKKLRVISQWTRFLEFDEFDRIGSVRNYKYIKHMFDKMKQFGSQGAAITKLAMLQKKIQKTKMEVEDQGVKAVVTGEGKLKELVIDGEDYGRAVKVINDAITKAQKYAADEMKDSMGDLSKVLGNLPR